MAEVLAVPSFGQPVVGDGGAVSIAPFTRPILPVVSVYVQPAPLSWKPVTTADPPVVPTFPLITVDVPWLVIPAELPKPPKTEAVPSGTGVGPATALVVKLHGFAATPDASVLPARSVAVLVMVA